MNVCLKMFQNFQRSYFYKHLWTAVAEFTGSSHSSYPLLLHLYMVKCVKWVQRWPILKIDFSVLGCNGHVVVYSFLGKVDSQSILMRVNFLLVVQFMYYAHQLITHYIALN